MKQLSFIPPTKNQRKREHGGSLSVGKRRSKRPLNTKESIHVTLRSEFAYGKRALTRHRPLIEGIIRKAAKSFQIRIYEKAICSNHIHLLVKGSHRQDLQNFFRVLAGHTAQGILKICPLQSWENKIPGGAPQKKQHPKNTRKFWALLLYSKLISWGNQYIDTKKYVLMNEMEALGIIPYQKRKSRYVYNSS